MAARVDEESRPDRPLTRCMYGHSPPVDTDLVDAHSKLDSDPFLAARMLQQQGVEAFAPNLEAHPGSVWTVVPSARFRAAPAYGMTEHAHESAALHRPA